MRCKRCGGSTLELDKYDILGNLIETNRKCFSCGHEQKEEKTQSAERREQSEKGKEVDMGKELTEEGKEAKRAYQREWYKNNSEWARRKEKGPSPPRDVQKGGQMADCKYHDGVPAMVDKGGRTTGLCKECVSARAGKARKSQKRKSSANRARRSLPVRVKKPPDVIEYEGKTLISTALLVQATKELRFELVYKLAEASILRETENRR